MRKNPVLIIAGPTASGKSALAIKSAKAFNGVILNCDAMQIYKDIPIIAATPNKNEKAEAEHRLYELYDCSIRGNVVDWLELCVTEIKKIWAEKRLPIVVGGTGFYINALINGVTPVPEVNKEVRDKINLRLQEKGLASLYQYLLSIDERTALKIGANDKTRITRAVEIYEYTKTTVTEWYKKPLIKKLPEANFCVVKIVPSIDEIAKRCKRRLDKMVFEQGVIKEIETLTKRNLSDNLPAMKALGVPELSMFVRGEKSLEEALELAKLHTRQYAKRQRTWLRNKLPADVIFDKAYIGQDDFIDIIKKSLNL
ncbi:MAG: tRNA (adenosine(37)-N6)-dimethylallyltransferase MiaA [Alphaproteobacteria bacterium]|nr:tRNA (adenosine(37)-N6)-dimethylallyltransferase MiaA [Alphaproteobacteria bacterium]